MAHDHKHREIVIDYKPDNLGIYEKVSVIQCLHLSMWTDIVLTGTKSLKFRKNETKITKPFSYFPLPLKIATALLSAFQGNWLISTTQQTITCSKLTIGTLEKIDMRSKFTIKTPERSQWSRSGVFIVNFEHISHLFLVFLLWTLSMYLFAGIGTFIFWKLSFIAFSNFQLLTLDLQTHFGEYGMLFRELNWKNRRGFKLWDTICKILLCVKPQHRGG